MDEATFFVVHPDHKHIRVRLSGYETKIHCSEKDAALLCAILCLLFSGWVSVDRIGYVTLWLISYWSAATVYLDSSLFQHTGNDFTAVAQLVEAIQQAKIGLPVRTIRHLKGVIRISSSG